MKICFSRSLSILEGEECKPGLAIINLEVEVRDKIKVKTEKGEFTLGEEK
ncbi:MULTISPECIES: hypothetical protein [Metallosphaera]|nr:MULTISPECIES: hypothetical protein [Metallosphaera]MCY0863092.1 hypothetical protein [Metallosphaera prunae]WPX07362.1 hypothetical protein SOJ17_001125 [Metallosphaera sedula DSM 5348]BBL47209.1 hypothetical protein MJ1HA_1310 [Metallosphaera sedula]